MLGTPARANGSPQSHRHIWRRVGSSIPAPLREGCNILGGAIVRCASLLPVGQAPPGCTEQWAHHRLEEQQLASDRANGAQDPRPPENLQQRPIKP